MSTCSSCGAALPAHARFCPSCGTSVGDTAVQHEERKVATVLFADLVASTELGEQDPERTRALLDRFYDAMAVEIGRAGGTVEKFAGDAVMAVFGAPTAHEDHAERALHAALAMRRRLGELFDGRLEMRIGVNTGEVVVGRPREGSSFVTGDAVNVCARLEQNGEAGQILVGERTVGHVRGAFEFDQPSRIEAKGKPGGIVCRPLLRALSLMRPRGVAGLGRAFVGRSDELETLLRTYRHVVESGRPAVVTVAGDAGVGKTTLVREFWQLLADETPPPLRRTGRCLPYGHGTFWPLAEILKEHFGLLESDSTEIVEQRLADRPMLGLTLGLEVDGELHPRAARERFQDAWTEFVDDLAQQESVVMLIEDLHLAEEPLFDLLERVVGTVSGPFLLLVSARPELFDRRPGWGVRSGATRIELDALAPTEAADMLRKLLGAEAPSSLENVVVQQAEGNPFFVEELLATFIDRDLLRREGDAWRLSELPGDLSVPDSIHTLLAARIDLLEPAEKAALQAASVIGRIFWTGPVYELLEGFDPDLDVLEERDFIRRRPGSSMAGDREYAIKHALTREVAYASLPKAKRARMHAAFAAWLERVAQDRDELASLLAHHYAAAVRPEDADLAWADEAERLERLRGAAVTWLERAADVARRRYEIDDAIALLLRALELDPPADVKARLWRQVGRAHALKYDGDGFWEAMEKALELSTDRAECSAIYSELALETAARSGMWKRAVDRDLLDRWIEQALELTQPGSHERVNALAAHAIVERSVTSARDASALAQRLDDVGLRWLAWNVRSIVARATEDHEQALEWGQRAFDVIDQISDPDRRADTYAAPIQSCIALGRFGEARRLARRHDEITARLTPHHRLHGVATLFEVETLLAGWETMQALAERVQRAVDENLDTPCVRNATSQLLCAQACEYLGDQEKARRLEERADALEFEGYRSLDIARIRLALARGDLEAVGALLTPETRGESWLGIITAATRLEALTALRDKDQTEAEAPAYAGKPRTYLQPVAIRALGVVRKDEALIRQALEQFEKLNLAWHAEQTRALL